MPLDIVAAATVHFLPGDFSERHIGVRYEQDHLVAGAFLNSEGDLSAALGLVWRDGPCFIEAGLATGYTAAPVVPMARLGCEVGRARFFIMPGATVEGDFGPVLGVEIIALRF